MNLKSQKRMAAEVMNIGENKVWIDATMGKEVSEAITKNDIRRLVNLGAIKAKPTVGTHGHAAMINRMQKKKGRRSGPGNRKGTKNARNNNKEQWMVKIRALRAELKRLKEGKKLSTSEYQKFYNMAGAGAFRDKSHLSITIEKFKQGVGQTTEKK